EKREDDTQAEKENRKRHEDADDRAAIRASTAWASSAPVFPACRLLDGRNRVVDPVGVAAFAESGSELLADDPRAESIGEGSLEAVSHLDAGLSLPHEDGEEHSVALFALPETPALEQAIDEVLEAHRFQRREGPHHDLPPA